MLRERIFNIANMSVNTIRENKILAKISGFTSILDSEQSKFIFSEIQPYFVCKLLT